MVIANFKLKIADYARWAREAYDLQGVDDAAALRAWQKLFGPEFAADEVKATRNDIVAVKVIRDLSSRNSVLPPAEFTPDEEFIENRYPLGASRYSATIEARVVGSPRYTLLCQQRAIGRSRTLRFRLHTDAPEPYEVLWKVRNRGPEAARFAEVYVVKSMSAATRAATYKRNQPATAVHITWRSMWCETVWWSPATTTR